MTSPCPHICRCRDKYGGNRSVRTPGGGRALRLLSIILFTIAVCVFPTSPPQWPLFASAGPVASNAVCYFGGDPLIMDPQRDAAGNAECGVGFHCPGFVSADPATWPVYCAPLPECLVQRAFGDQCAPASDQEPIICQPGTYCPDATTILECPSGYYCTFATERPLKCPILSYCPAGSDKLLFFGGALISVLLLLAFVGILLLYRLYLRYSTLNDRYEEADRFLAAVEEDWPPLEAGGEEEEDANRSPTNESDCGGSDGRSGATPKSGESLSRSTNGQRLLISSANSGSHLFPPENVNAGAEASASASPSSPNMRDDGDEAEGASLLASRSGAGHDGAERSAAAMDSAASPQGRGDAASPSSSAATTASPQTNASRSAATAEETNADEEGATSSSASTAEEEEEEAEATARRQQAIKVLAGGFLMARSTKPLTYVIRDMAVTAPKNRSAAQKGQLYGEAADKKRAKERAAEDNLLAIAESDPAATEADKKRAARIVERREAEAAHQSIIPSFVPFCGRKEERIPILHGVTATFLPSTVTAILGPGGSGKSTLLNAMLGRLPAGWRREGYVAVNGDDSPEVTDRLRGVIGSATQTEPLHRELTVYQNLYYPSQVRLPSSWSGKERAIFLAATMEALQLTKQKDVVIGDEESRGVSGGQRRRCHIGIEIAAAPYALFLDEPTNGLDATTALEVCSCLSTIAAAAGLTVIMTISQPRIEIWNALDNIIVIARGGRTVYQGTRADCLEFFQDVFDVSFQQSANPSDIIVDAVAADGAALAQRWAEYSADPSAFAEKRAEAKERRLKKEAKDARRRAAEEAAMGFSGDEHILSVSSCGGSFYPPPPATRTLPPPPALDNGSPAAVASNPRHQWPRVVGGVANEPFDPASPCIPPPSVASTAAGGMDGGPLIVGQRTRNAPDDFGESTMSKQSAGHKEEQPPLRSGCCSFFPCASSSASDNPSAIRITRTNASFPRQVFTVFRRSIATQLSDLQPFLVEQVVNIVVASAIGVSSTDYKPYWRYQWYQLVSPPADVMMPQIIMYLCMALGIICVMPGSAIFVNCRESYFREASAGLSKPAFYVGMVLSLQPRIILTACIFTTLFLIIPRLAVSWIKIGVCVWFIASCSYVLGIFPAMMFSAASAPLVGTLLSIFFSCLSGFITKFPVGLKYVSYAYWASSMLQRFIQHSVSQTLEDLAKQGEWISDDIGLCVGILFLILVVFHVIAFLAMIYFDRAKQR